MIIARQSTARTMMIGPVLDASGVAVTDCVVADFEGSVNGGDPAALNGSATLTHRGVGFYSLALTATDLATVGQFEVTINDTTNGCAMKEITVVEEAVYDAFYAASALGYIANAPVNVAQVTNGVNGLQRAGTSQAVGATTLTMDSGASYADNALTGNIVKLTDGTNIGVTGIITSNVGSTDVVTLSGGWSNGATPTGTPTFEIWGTAPGASLAAFADAVWDEALSGHTTSGTAGKALSDASSAGDPWATAIPGAYAAGTAGSRLGKLPDVTAGAAGGVFIAGTNAATTITTGLTTTFIGNQTGNLSGSVGSVTGAVGSVTGAVGSVTGNVGGNVTGSVGSVVGAVGSVTGNVGGNVTGSVGSVVGAVGSVTGAVGSVTGNVGGNVIGSVGGNVTGSVASVTGAVGSVTGNVGGNVTGSVGSLAAQAKTDVNAEMLDVLVTDTFTQPASVPAATTSIKNMLGWIYTLGRNKITQTSGAQVLRNDGDTVTIATAAVSDDSTTNTRGQFS